MNCLIIGVELPFTLNFLYQGNAQQTMCTVWITLNYSLFELSIYLVALTSIERYLFIYYEQFMQQHIIIFHFIPSGFILLYCPLFYIGVVVLYTCQPAYDINLYLCGGACYQFERILGFVDWLGNGIVIVMITFFVNMALIIHRLIKRRKVQNVITRAQRQKLVKY